MRLATSLFKNSSQSVLGGIISAAGSFAATVIVARTLGVQGTAAVSIALWIVLASTTLADLGISGTTARYVAGAGHPDDTIGPETIAAYSFRVFLFAILVGLSLTAGFLALYWQDILSKYSASRPQALVFCTLVLTCFVVHMLNAFAYQYLRGLRSFGRITLYSAIGAASQVAGVAAGAIWFGVNGALAGYIAFSVPIIWSVRRLKPFGAIPPSDLRKDMQVYALGFYYAALFSPLLWTRAEIMIVDQFLGVTAVGLFAAAATVAALLLQVCQMVCNALLPEIVHAAKGDRADFERASRLAARLALSLLIPACLIGAAAAPGALTIIFGEAFGAGGGVAALLCLGALGSAVTIVIGSVLAADGRNSDLARNGMAGAVLTVVSGISMVLALGLVGAAASRLASQTIVASLNARSVQRCVPHLVQPVWLGRVTGAAALGASVTWGIQVIGDGSPLSLVAAIAGGGVAYLAAAALLIPLHPADKARLASASQALPGRWHGIVALVLKHK